MHLGFSSMNTADDPAPPLLAKTLEEAGFESLWYGEHSHIPVERRTPYPPGGDLPEPYKKMMDPYISLMAAAAATTTLKLGTGIALLMERELFSQAKTIATLDRLSNGRVVIGCGVGWNQEEFENATRLPFNRRYLALKETVQHEGAGTAPPEPCGDRTSPPEPAHGCALNPRHFGVFRWATGRGVFRWGRTRIMRLPEKELSHRTINQL
jgi:alkanesulfonate monooxygenase SsuD/methylene tetrahydromethanopterin reductase-like flavin-dependent oxidoreductase (luciferase family)